MHSIKSELGLLKKIKILELQCLRYAIGLSFKSRSSYLLYMFTFTKIYL
jgi:hypothetical protein